MPSSSFRLPASVQQLAQRHGARVPRLAEWALTAAVAYATAVFTWTLVPVPEAARWTPPPASAAPAAGRTGPNVEAIVAAHLYGEAAAPTATAQQDSMDEAPDTRLNLTLLGILAATADRSSRALIASSGGEEKPYAIGSDVIGGVSLQAIFADRVILSRAGQLETLRLDKDAPSRAPVETARPTVASANANSAAVLSNIRNELLNDPSRANEYIRMQPSASGGQLRGYRIYPGRDRAVFNAAGLRPGDLVTEVNGIQLNDANTALQMLGQLSSATSLTVVVERGGQQQTVNVNFNP